MVVFVTLEMRQGLLPTNTSVQSSLATKPEPVMMIVSRVVPCWGEIDVISDARHVKNATWNSTGSVLVHSVIGMLAHSTDLFLLFFSATSYTFVCLLFLYKLMMMT